MSRYQLPLFLLLAASGCSNREELKELAHEPGRFRIRMPVGGHTAKTEPLVDAGGKKSIRVSFNHVTGKYGYIVSYIDTHFPETESEQEKFKKLKNSESFAMTNQKATLVESKTSLLQEKYPAIDWIATVPDKKSIRCKEVFVKNRLYSIQAIGDENFVKSADVNDFFQSFQVSP